MMSPSDPKKRSGQHRSGGGEAAETCLPLYTEARVVMAGQAVCPAQANCGLWYDKFCNEWQKTGEWWYLDSNKEKWIRKVTDHKACGKVELLNEAVKRYVSCVTACGGRVRIYRTVGRFVTGLGREHPVENGFAWHYLLGTPYLPGSSIKGVLRDWAESWWEGREVTNPQELVQTLFGPENGEKRAGGLIFFDALPVEPVKLQVEVLTPHYGPYYKSSGKGKQPPADWYDPVPIPFLTVAEGQHFIFGIAPRRKNGADLDLVFSWLDQALSVHGAGAKTASGYGCFKPDPTCKIPEADQTPTGKSVNEEQMSAIRKEMEEDGYSDKNEQRFMSKMAEKWLVRMQHSETSRADRLEIAQWLAAWYQKNRLQDWQNPKNEKNRRKVALIKQYLSGEE